MSQPTARRWQHLTLAVLFAVSLILALLALAGWTLPARAASFVVTKTEDTADGACDADCSLREAIIAANADPGHDTITLGPGVYTLSRLGRNEDRGQGIWRFRRPYLDRSWRRSRASLMASDLAR